MDNPIVQCYAKNVNEHLVTKDGDFEMYNKQDLLNHIDNLISWNMQLTKDGYQVYVKQIPKDDKRTFAALLIAHEDTELACIHSNDKLTHIRAAILASLTKNDLHETEKLRELLMDAIVLHFENTMQEMIDERLKENEVAVNWDSGLRPSRYDDNGEIRWVRA